MSGQIVGVLGCVCAVAYAAAMGWELRRHRREREHLRAAEHTTP